MMISTKGRYALRVMLDLAANDEGKPISLKDVATRQDISMKYLEMIVSMLNKGGLVTSQRGKSGGYRLAQSADKCYVGDILRVAEGTLAPVQCLQEGAQKCKRADECITLPLWTKMDNMVTEYLDSVTLEDLIKKRL